MDWNKPEEGFGKVNNEKPLPRGLETVSHLFLSHTQPDRTVPVDHSQTATAELRHAATAEQPVTVVLRPCQFLEREQLVSLLRKQTAALEDGMKVIDSNVPCEMNASIDLLAVDNTSQLAIIEMDERPNDALLLRAMSHLDWLSRNMPSVRRMYPGHVINFSVPPRIFLVAPEFSALLRCVTRQITSVQLTCVKYHAIALSGGTGIFFEPLLEHGFAPRH